MIYHASWGNLFNSKISTCIVMFVLIAYCATPVAPTFTTLKRNDPPLNAKKTQLTEDMAKRELYPQTPSYT